MIELAPVAVLTHTDVDPFNPDHPVAHRAVARVRLLAMGAGGVPAAFPTIRPPALLVFEPHQPEACGFAPDTFVDVTAVWERKQSAMAAVGSQRYLAEHYAELVQIVPGSRVAGPARTVLCGQDDNLGVHEALEHVAAGEVLVVAKPQPAPVALVGDLLALQAKVRRIAGLLLDAAVRDHDRLADLGLPIWARWIRAAGADKQRPGKLDATVIVGGQRIAQGDYLVMDADGAIAVAKDRVVDVVEAASRRGESEQAMRARLAAGELTLDLLGLRAR